MDLGLSEIGIALALRDGLLAQPLRGVYVAPTALEDPAVRAAALAMVLPPGAAVARHTAAWLFGVDCRPPGGQHEPVPLCCIVPAGTTTPPRRPGVRAFAATLPSGDVVQRLGVPVTSPERTVLDLARYLPAYLGLATADAFAHRRLVDLDQLRARVEQFQGGRWIDRARRVLALADARAESFGGEEYHSADDDREHDERRREDLAKHFDWEVLGVGKGEVLGRSLRLERAVGELLSLEPQISRRAW